MSVSAEEITGFLESSEELSAPQSGTVVIDFETIKRLGMTLKDDYEKYLQTRNTIENQWQRNYRQYRGIYDPEIEKLIPEGFSKAYPRITRTKVRGLVAKLMEMLFPTGDKNWSIKPTAVPNPPASELTRILQELEASIKQQAQAAQQSEQPVDQSALQLTDDMIEEAIMNWAKERAINMEEEIYDQLQENKSNFISQIKKVVRSAVLYGLGILRGPMVNFSFRRTWVQEEEGNYRAQEIPVQLPYFEWVRVWDFVTDFTVKDFSQCDKFYENHVMTKYDLETLRERPDFLKAQIDLALRNHPEGNYKRPEWESTLNQMNNGTTETEEKNVSNLFSVCQMVGFVDGKDLQAAGASIPEDKMNEKLLAEIWMIEDTVIKAKKMIWDTPLEYYHLFLLDEEESETSPIGANVPDSMRDSQMAVSASARMIFDNAGITTGPQFEINKDLMSPGMNNMRIHAFKSWYREGQGQEASYPAIRQLTFDSHINELMAIMNQFREFSDEEAMLPKWALGIAANAGGEAFRTTGGASMAHGAANMTIKDIVRQYDKFSISFLTSLYRWNMLYNPRSDIKGDLQIVARGATSLLAKELRASSLDQLVNTLAPEEREHVDFRSILKERMKSRDLLPEEFLLDEATVNRNREARQASQQQMLDSERVLNEARAKKLLTSAAKEITDAKQKGDLTDANIREILTRAYKNIMDTQFKGKQTDATVFSQLFSQLQQSQQFQLPESSGEEGVENV